MVEVRRVQRVRTRERVVNLRFSCLPFLKPRAALSAAHQTALLARAVVLERRLQLALPHVELLFAVQVVVEAAGRGNVPVATVVTVRLVAFLVTLDQLVHFLAWIVQQ